MVCSYINAEAVASRSMMDKATKNKYCRAIIVNIASVGLGSEENIYVNPDS